MSGSLAGRSHDENPRVSRQARAPAETQTHGRAKERHGSAPEMIADLPKGAMPRADKGYDANALRDAVAQREAMANIPPRSNRKVPICFSKHLYKAHNPVGRLFNKIKYYRRIAMR
jgi:transposase